MRAERVFAQVASLLKENVGVTLRKDGMDPKGEDHILAQWGLAGSREPPRIAARATARWTFPPIGWASITFDGASKGNPGPARVGAIIRNDQGIILANVAEPLGQNSSNFAEARAAYLGGQCGILFRSQENRSDGRFPEHYKGHQGENQANLLGPDSDCLDQNDAGSHG